MLFPQARSPLPYMSLSASLLERLFLWWVSDRSAFSTSTYSARVVVVGSATRVWCMVCSITSIAPGLTRAAERACFKSSGGESDIMLTCPLGAPSDAQAMTRAQPPPRKGSVGSAEAPRGLSSGRRARKRRQTKRALVRRRRAGARRRKGEKVPQLTADPSLGLPQPPVCDNGVGHAWPIGGRR